MSKAADRRREFDAIVNDPDQTQPNVPPTHLSDESPFRCTISRSGMHKNWTSQLDGKRRCYYCCRVTEPVTP